MYAMIEKNVVIALISFIYCFKYCDFRIIQNDLPLSDQNHPGVNFLFYVTKLLFQQLF